MKEVAKEDGRQVLNLKYEDGIEAFNRKKEVFKRLKINDIKKEHYGSEKPTRDIKGGILRRVVLREMPDLRSNKEKIKIDAQALHKRLINIQKNSLKNSPFIVLS
jgi:isopentenyl phosphate kinase